MSDANIPYTWEMFSLPEPVPFQEWDAEAGRYFNLIGRYGVQIMRDGQPVSRLEGPFTSLDTAGPAARAEIERLERQSKE